jgi:signal transduction histidine kinase
MRSLLSELREQAAERPRLHLALRDLADSVSRRDGLLVALAVPETDVVDLPSATVEHLVRITGEALHNTVKHADARRATVSVTVENGQLVLSVEDDGRGFDAAVSRSLGHGQRTMRERAELAGGSLSVVSRPGHGTAVVTRVPIHA